jgi:hypothetical protein
MDPREQHETSRPQRPSSSRRRARIAEFSSLFALVVSFIALGLGAYQARLMNLQTGLMQTQAKASVWPYLSIGYSLSDEGEKRGFTWEINNDGVGPARIESVTLSLDGKPLRKWSEVFHDLFGDAKVLASYNKIYGKVLPPNTNRETTIEAVRIADIEQAKIFYDAQSRFEMTICYCSVYDECWIARRNTPDVQSVARCDTAGTVQFEEKM